MAMVSEEAGFKVRLGSSLMKIFDHMKGMARHNHRQRLPEDLRSRYAARNLEKLVDFVRRLLSLIFLIVIVYGVVQINFFRNMFQLGCIILFFRNMLRVFSFDRLYAYFPHSDAQEIIQAEENCESGGRPSYGRGSQSSEYFVLCLYFIVCLCYCVFTMMCSNHRFS